MTSRLGVAAASSTWQIAMTATCSRVTSRPRVSALKMMGSRYRFRRGLELLPVNHSTPVMNITMDQDSISRRVRVVSPGKNQRERKATMATTKAQSRPSTGHSWAVGTRDQTTTSATSARQSISMDRVLRTLPESSRRRDRAAGAHGRYLQFLNRPPYFRVTLQQRRVGGHGFSGRLWIARELDVGDDPSVIDGYSGRCVIKRRGQLDGAVSRQGNDGLYRALAESRASHELRAMVVFERTGDDLRRRRRSAVDEYHDRRAVERVAGRRIHFKCGLRRAPLGGHDDARVEKGIGDRYRRLEHAARIVAQIEHQTLERRPIALAQVFERGVQIIAGGFAELGNPHIPHAGLEELGPHAA